MEDYRLDPKQSMRVKIKWKIMVGIMINMHTLFRHIA